MSSRIEHSGLSVAAELYLMVNAEIAPGAGVDPDAFWAGYSAIVDELGPKNRELLDKRDRIQEQIDAWHRQHPGALDHSAYRAFLEKIGYLVPEGEAFAIGTSNVDPEIARIMSMFQSEGTDDMLGDDFTETFGDFDNERN